MLSTDGEACSRCSAKFEIYLPLSSGDNAGLVVYVGCYSQAISSGRCVAVCIFLTPQATIRRVRRAVSRAAKGVM